MKKNLLVLLGILVFSQSLWAQCSTPSAASGLLLNATDTSISVYFDSTNTASEYLGIVSTSATLSATPANGTTYNVGTSFGGGKVVYRASNYVFKIDGLLAGTKYYIFVYSAKTGCTGAPAYSTNALSGNITTFAQRGIPAGYYSSITNQTCAALKTALFNIIKPTVANPNPTYKGILGAAQLTDGRMNDNGTKFIVWDQYSDNPTGPEPYEFTFGSPYQDRGTLGNNEGERYNREHTFPQAWFASAEPMQSDLFIVYSSDKKVNAQRADNPYGKVGGASTFLSLNGSKLGNNTFSASYTQPVFEPIDTYKGDLARANLYVAVAFEDKVVADNWKANSNANDVLDGTVYPFYDPWYIQLLYTWHVQDPVSQKEIDRNNNVYMIQGNRNPFIDHPEYVALIWQCSNAIPVTLIDFKATKYSSSVVLNWYATHEVGFTSFDIERSTDGSNFTKIGTVRGQNLANYDFTDANLPLARTVFYRLKLIDQDSKFNYSKIVSVTLHNRLFNALVYPNPVHGNLTIRMQQPLSATSQLTITDIAGRKVKESMIGASGNTINLDVESLPSGKYFIRIQNENELINESFMITR